jgi:hypothetical protein
MTLAVASVPYISCEKVSVGDTVTNNATRTNCFIVESRRIGEGLRTNCPTM